jgi:methylmalonyl-CoA/ethylmalonyl-CoA epimerase
VEITGVKHIAVAVKSVEQTLQLYQRLLGVGEIPIKEMEKARTREAWVKVGGVEFQLIEPLPGENRYSLFMEARNGEGVHHVCYTVDDIDAALRWRPAGRTRWRGRTSTPRAG